MPSSDTQFQPGTPKPPGSGRRPGVPNKRSTMINNALTAVVLGSMPNFATYLAQHAKVGPQRFANQDQFFDMMMKLINRIAPNDTVISSDDKFLPVDDVDTNPIPDLPDPELDMSHPDAVRVGEMLGMIPKEMRHMMPPDCREYLDKYEAHKVAKAMT